MYVNLTSNLSGSVRRAVLNGRECLVAPVTLIVPGVLQGSHGPLMYPSDELARDPAAWNGVPIVVYHPMTDDGRPLSAKAPGVLRRQGIGVVRGAKHNHKLTAEGWFDVENTRRVDKRILYALEEGKPIELSTGLYTDNEPRQGAYNGRRYEYIARNYRPDHLAILPDSTGACSIADGCGVLVNRNSRREDLNMRRSRPLEIPVINHLENCSPALRTNCGCQHNNEEHDDQVQNSYGPLLPIPVMNWELGASPYLTGRMKKPGSFNG